MLGDYGSDDLPWLIEQGGGDAVEVGRWSARTAPGRRIRQPGRSHVVPARRSGAMAGYGDLGAPFRAPRGVRSPRSVGPFLPPRAGGAE